MIRIVRIVLAFLIIPLSVVFGLALSDTDGNRFKAGYGSCVMREIAETQGEDYDLIVIGGSRMGSLVRVKPYQRQFEKRYGRPLKILRLVIPQYDLGLGYSLLRATLKRHHARHALVMMEGYSAGLKHDEAYRLWRLSELWQVFKLDGYRGIQGASQLAHLLLQRLRDVVFLRPQTCEEHSKFVKAVREKREKADREAMGKPSADRETMRAAMRERLAEYRDIVREQQGFGLAVFDILSPDNAYLRHFSESIVKLLKKNDSGVTFIRIAGIAERQWGTGWLRQFELYTGAALLQIPEETRWRLMEALSFSDATHLSPKGARLVRPWLIAQLVDRGL